MIEQCRLGCRSHICVRRFEGDDSLALTSRDGVTADATAEWPADGAQGDLGAPGSNTLVNSCVPRDDTGQALAISNWL